MGKSGAQEYIGTEPTDQERSLWAESGMKIRNPQQKRVLCLGHGPEHYFMSPDSKNIRICPTCRGNGHRTRAHDYADFPGGKPWDGRIGIRKT